MRPLVAANLIANITEVLEPPLQIQEANKGTYHPEYYITIHRCWLVMQRGMACRLQHS